MDFTPSSPEPTYTPPLLSCFASHSTKAKGKQHYKMQNSMQFHDWFKLNILELYSTVIVQIMCCELIDVRDIFLSIR